MAEQRPPDVPPEHDNPQVGHERSDANVSAVVKFAVGFVVAAVLAHLILAWLFGVLARRADRGQPKLTPLARQEREQKQEQAEERFKKVVKKIESRPFPEPPLVYERMQAIPSPRLQVSDVVDLKLLREQEDRKLRVLAGLNEEAGRSLAETEKEVLEKALKLLQGNSEAAQRLGLQAPAAQGAGKGGR
jgi:type IV secretory pathway VirB10-like protein